MNFNICRWREGIEERHIHVKFLAIGAVSKLVGERRDKEGRKKKSEKNIHSCPSSWQH